MGPDVAKSDVTSLLVLILPHAQVASHIVHDIFPRAAAHYLALHTVRVFNGRVVTVFGIQVAREAAYTLRIGRRSPLAHVARHVVKAEVVWRISAHPRGYYVTVAHIVALIGLEIGIEASFVIRHRQVTVPRVLVLAPAARAAYSHSASVGKR